MAMVLSRADLRRDGIGSAQLRRRQRAGTLVRVGYDSYAGAGSSTREELVLARPGGGAALFGASAAAHHGLPAAPSALEIVVPHGSRRRWVGDKVIVHQARRWEAEIVAGVVVTSVARSLADLARTSPWNESVPVLDAGLRAGVSRTDIVRELDACAGGRRRALAAVDLADGRAESPLESRLRLLLVDAGLAPDDLQHELREGDRFVARVDLWFDGVVVEADGFEFHATRAAYRRDRRKGQAYGRLGLLLLRFSWEDVHFAPDEVVATVRQTLLRTAA